MKVNELLVQAIQEWETTQHSIQSELVKAGIKKRWYTKYTNPILYNEDEQNNKSIRTKKVNSKTTNNKSKK